MPRRRDCGRAGDPCGPPLLPLALALAAALWPSAASATRALAGEFPVSGTPKQLALGPDGNVWFTMTGSPTLKEIGRITPDGTVTEYNPPAGVTGDTGIAAGPDGRLWTTATQKVVRIDPANPAAGVAFPVADLTDPRAIVAGPDGNLWTASVDKVIRISTAGAVLNTYTVAGMGARGIAAGGDGNLWVVDFGNQRIVRVTTAGMATPFPVGGGPQEIAAGPAGRLVFTNPGATPQFVGRMAYDGAFQPTGTPLADPFGIVFGQDGAYWTAQFAGQSLGRITPDGVYTTLPLPAGSGPRYLARGAGGTLWVGLETTQKIARITGVTAPPGPGGPTPPGAARTLSGLRLESSTLLVGGPGTRLRLRSSAAGRATLRVLRALPGRLRAGRCLAPAHASRRARRCTRHVLVGTLVRPVGAGANALTLRARIGRRVLRPAPTASRSR